MQAVAVAEVVAAATVQEDQAVAEQEEFLQDQIILVAVAEQDMLEDQVLL
jgi:hypothetical protein